MNTLEAKHVSKTIKGARVLSDISLTLEGGKIYAFQGENGCGKTMLFRVLSGLSAPTSGQVILNGTDLNKPHKNIINLGLTIENASLFPQFTGLQNLKYLAQIKRLADMNQLRSSLLRVGLDPDDRRTVRKYSLGMKQRLLIAQAIMESPDFLLLDEPTNAIDRDGVDLVHQIIREEASRGAVVLMASHIDKDVSCLADTIYRMKAGCLEHEG